MARQGIYEDKPGERNLLHLSLWVATAVITFWVGWIYIGRRPLTGEYELDATHGLGKWLGWIATALFLGTLTYIPRKRGGHKVDRWPSRSFFMDWHVFFGIVGFILGCYHVAFAVHSHESFSMIGWNIFVWTFWTAIIVVVTGALGRYMAGWLRKFEVRSELKLEDKRAEAYQVEDRLSEIFKGSDRKKGDGRLAELEKKLHEIEKDADLPEVKTLLATKEAVERQLAYHERVHKLIGSWFHVHVVVSAVVFLALGYHIYREVRQWGWF